MSATTVHGADEAVAAMDQFVDEWVEEDIKLIKNVSAVALKKADKEISAYQKAEIQRVYDVAIKRFYEDYRPHVYKRTESLYDLIEIRAFDDTNEVEWDYDPTKMVSTRRGMSGGKEYLFDTVFGQGWHGGADKIAPWKVARYKAHPSPGVPYYRTPPKGKRRYTKWTKHPAERAAKSPYEMAQAMIQELDEPGGKFWTEYERLADYYIDKAIEKL